MVEVNAKQAIRIRNKIEMGMDPSQAIDEVLKEGDTSIIIPKKKANTMPSTKKKLGEWLKKRVEVVEEYPFHPTRKWRFDWYIPSHAIAVEYEGMMTQGANVGHASISGIMRDVEKYNEATAMGILVFRAHAENIRTGTFFKLMESVLEGGDPT